MNPIAVARSAIALALLIAPLALLHGCADRSVDPRAISASARCVAPPPRSPDTLLLAGSGAAIAPLSAIMAAYRREHPTARVEIAPSIGTGGALRALRDGAIDVGLAARPLSAKERRGLQVSPLAEVPLVLATQRRTGLPTPFDVGVAQALLARRGARWPDGRPVLPLYRQRGDAVDKALQRSAPSLARVFATARAQRRGLTCYTDQQLARNLSGAPGALGVLDLGSLRLNKLPLRHLRLRDATGAEPTLSLALVYRPPPASVAVELERLLAFIARPATAAILRRVGYRVRSTPSSQASQPSSGAGRDAGRERRR
jgi:phosphate transport system substrate-binding protein